MKGAWLRKGRSEDVHRTCEATRLDRCREGRDCRGARNKGDVSGRDVTKEGRGIQKEEGRDCRGARNKGDVSGRDVTKEGRGIQKEEGRDERHMTGQEGTCL